MECDGAYEYIPRWMLKRLKLLWEAFEAKEFTFKQSLTVLKGDDPRLLGILLSRLVRAGWLSSKHEKTMKGSIAVYKIAHPEDMPSIDKIILV